MSDVLVIQQLLLAAAPLAAIVPADKIVIGTVRQGIILPAVGIKHISTAPLSRIDAQADFGIVTCRVQVTAITNDYAVMKRILNACRKACNYQRGLIAGVQVISVVRDADGPDPDEGPANIFDQAMDFKVTYHEPN